MDIKTTKWQLCGRLLLCLMVLAAAVFYRDTLREVLGGVRRISARGCCAGVLLSAAAYALEGMTISCMAGAAVSRLPVKKGIAIALICEFYRMVTLGNGSGIAEIHYLHQEGMEPGSAAVMTMIQYMVKRTAVMLLGILGFLGLYCSGSGRGICREYAVFMGFGCAVTLGVIACFMGLALSSKIAAWSGAALGWMGRKLPSWEKRISGWQQQIALLNRSGKTMITQKRRLFGAVSLQMGKMAFFYAIPACIVYPHTGIAFVENILLMAAAYLLAGVIPAPSGAGALEFVFLLFFTEFVDAGTALPAILLFRFVTWILPFGAGAAVLLWRRLRKK